jgi:uncharacterized tellurite resistance protein B-like protein
MAAPSDLDHRARSLPEAERIEYLTAVASLVVADAHVDDAELAVLGRLCRALDVSAEAQERVIAAARSPDRAAVERALAEVAKDADLRTSLLADAIVVAFADGKLMPGETQHIDDFARRLGLTQAQAVLISRHVEAIVRAERAASGDATSPMTRLSSELAQGLTAEGDARRRDGSVRWLWRALGKA